MKIGVIQFQPFFGKIEKNFSRVEKIVSSAEFVDIIVLPELFATGYLFENETELNKLSEKFGKGPTYDFLCGLSKSSGSAFIAGFAEKYEDKFFNSSMFISPDGKRAIYRKLHLFDREKLFFTPGDIPLEPIEYKGIRLGMIICFDWIFPETYRTLALKGVDLVCHSANLVLPYCQRASFANAVSNGIYIALSNRIGKESRGDISLKFTGGSLIYNPKGELLASLSKTDEGIISAEIDLVLSRNKQVTARNDLFADRRPEYYEMD